MSTPIDKKSFPDVEKDFYHPVGKDSYFIDENKRFQRGPFSQLIQMKLALPTIWVSGTKPQTRLS